MAGSHCRAAAAALAVIVALGTGAASAETPLEVVRSSNDAVLAILEKHPVLDAGTERELFDVIDAVTDFEHLAGSVIDPFCDRITPAECVELKGIFTRLLRVTSIKKLGRYRADGFEYLGEQVEGETALVQSVAIYEEDRIPLDYRLSRRGEGWMIVNYIVDEIDTTRNYRKQFTSLFAREAFLAIAARLNRKIAEYEAEK